MKILESCFEPPTLALLALPVDKSGVSFDSAASAPLAPRTVLPLLRNDLMHDVVVCGGPHV